MAARSIARNADLEYYYSHECEAELGEKSSFGAFVEMAMSGVMPGGRTDWDGMTERKLNSVARERRIRDRISKLSYHHKMALELWHRTPLQGPERSEWKRILRVAQFCAGMQSAFAKACERGTAVEGEFDRWARRVSRDEKARASMTEQALKLVADALAKYEAMCGR